jgi:transposase
MQIDLQNLPTDTALLHRLVCDIAATIEHRDSEIDRLKSIIKQLQRAQFGRRSERLDPDQLALGLEDLDGDLARAHESGPRVQNRQSERTSHRKPLPDHLPRDEVRLDIDDMTCACCGGALHVIGESASEMLDWVPAQLRVIRTTRPKYACCSCATMAQAPAPDRVIAGGLATPALLAQVMVSKYCDHTPLYRQSQIFARHGVDLPRSTLAGWVGGACWWLEALHERWPKTCLPPTICLPTTRRSRCSIPVADVPRPDVSGFMPASNAAGVDRSRRRQSLCSHRTARLSVRLHISNTSGAFCTSTAMPASNL